MNNMGNPNPLLGRHMRAAVPDLGESPNRRYAAFTQGMTKGRQ
jgi:hypothetical protein